MAFHESSVDRAIAKICAERGAYRRKIHGGEFVSGLLDNLICYKGVFIVIESKLPKDKLRPGQRNTIRDTQRAGGIAELCFDPNLLTKIFDSIDEGKLWQNGQYD